MLKELLDQLAASSKGLETLRDKAFGNDGTPEDLTALQDALTTHKALTGKVEVARQAEEAIKDGARDERQDPNSNRSTAVAKSVTDPAEKLGVILRSMLRNKHEGLPVNSKSILARMTEDGYGALSSEFATKANTTLTGASGGFLVPPNFNRTLIDLLYNESSFVAGNPVRIPMPNGNYRQAAGASSAVATYRGEGDDIAISQPTFRDIDMSSKLLSALVPVTNQLIDYSDGEISDFVRTDMAQVMSLKMDEMAYLGTGSGATPQGILRKSGIISVAATTGGSPTVGTIEADAKKLMAQLHRYRGLRNRLEWRMSPRTHLYLTMLRASGGDNMLLYPGLTVDGGTWMGLPVRIAGTFPENLGAGTNESYIALISFGNVLLGESKGLTLDFSSEASYKDGGGVMQSAFQNDSTLFRARMEHDVELRYNQAVALLTGVTWGI